MSEIEIFENFIDDIYKMMSFDHVLLIRDEDAVVNIHHCFDDIQYYGNFQCIGRISQGDDWRPDHPVNPVDFKTYRMANTLEWM